MPYIEKEYRQYWGPKIAQIEEALQAETPAGEINYVITKILLAWIKGKLKYVKICLVMGTLICVAFEFYRRIAAPYEEKKIKENGDVYK